MALPVPTLHTRIAVVSFDRETELLDTLIAAKQRFLKLVVEKRSSLSTRDVTRGLNPDAPLLDSGIPWLGEIPAHWGVWKTESARWLFRERDQRSELGDEELLTVSHITGVTPRSEKDVYMFEAKTRQGYKICRKGDLVINTLWAWMGAMGVSPVDGIVSPAYHVYELNEHLEPGYVDALVRLPVFAQEVARYSKGVWSSRLRLYPESFYEVYIPVPPLAEQRDIILSIGYQIDQLNAFKLEAERTISLLKERRSSLITGAVTGQIEIESAP